MGAELGATTSTFPYTPAMRDYLIATGRAPVAKAADRAKQHGYLERDEGAEWDQLVEIVGNHQLHFIAHVLKALFRICLQ